jgi:hypothetical protein
MRPRRLRLAGCSEPESHGRGGRPPAEPGTVSLSHLPSQVHLPPSCTVTVTVTASPGLAQAGGGTELSASGTPVPVARRVTLLQD